MIAISAGHHPIARGANYGMFYEHDEAVLWANCLVDYLGDTGMLVPTGFLRDKVNFINGNSEIGLAVEIHFNSAKIDGRHVGRGCETLFYPGSAKGKAIAKRIQGTLLTLFEPNRGAKEGYYQMNPEKGPDFFLARIRCPAIIIEPQFIQYKNEIQEKRQQACQALANTLLTITQEIEHGTF